MIEKLVCSLGRHDEKPNIEIAVSLCENPNRKAIAELADGLDNPDKAVVSDCIKCSI